MAMMQYDDSMIKMACQHGDDDEEEEEDDDDDDDDHRNVPFDHSSISGRQFQHLPCNPPRCKSTSPY